MKKKLAILIVMAFACIITATFAINNYLKLVHDTIYSKKYLAYKVKVTRRSESEIRDMKWHPIFRSIMQETDKQFHEVTGFASSFHPKPLEIIIKTSLSGKESSSKRSAEKIEEYVKQVIQIRRKELSVKKIPYEVIVRSKENTKLN